MNNIFTFLEMGKSYKKIKVSEFFTTLHSCIKIYGTDKIIKALYNLEASENNTTYDNTKNIITSVICREFDISEEVLFNSNERGDVPLAKKFFIILMKKYLKVSVKQLAFLFNRHKQFIYNVTQEFRKYSIDNEVDRKIFLDKLEKVDSEVMKFLSQKKRK